MTPSLLVVLVLVLVVRPQRRCVLLRQLTLAMVVGAVAVAIATVAAGAGSQGGVLGVMHSAHGISAGVGRRRGSGGRAEVRTKPTGKRRDAVALAWRRRLAQPAHAWGCIERGHGHVWVEATKEAVADEGGAESAWACCCVLLCIEDILPV